MNRAAGIAVAVGLVVVGLGAYQALRVDSESTEVVTEDIDAATEHEDAATDSASTEPQPKNEQDAPSSESTEVVTEDIDAATEHEDAATDSASTEPQPKNEQDAPSSESTEVSGRILLQPVDVNPFEIQIAAGWTLEYVEYPVLFENYGFDVFLGVSLRAGNQHERMAGLYCHPQDCLIATDEILESGARLIGWEPWKGAGALYWTIGTDLWTVLIEGASTGITEEIDAISRTLSVAFDPHAPTTVTPDVATDILERIRHARMRLWSPDGARVLVSMHDGCLHQEQVPWQCIDGLGVVGPDDFTMAISRP